MSKLLQSFFSSQSCHPSSFSRSS